MTPPPIIPPVLEWRCNRRVGFLYPHKCERLTPVDCPDCRNGQVLDPYRTRSDRYGYSENEFDNYGWNAEDAAIAAGAVAVGGGDSGGAGANLEFSEADGENLVSTDENFEDDLSAS